MTIELDNLKIENIMNKDGVMVYQVLDTDTNELLFIGSKLDYAEGFAKTHLNMLKEEA